MWDERGTPAAVSVTFDNLGEASELEMGVWPDDAPAGEHFSVVEILPRLVDLLAEHSLAATFFVEGINAELYPDALRDLAGRGHEVGLHAWRHESWGELGPARERELLTRGTAALRELSIEPAGFRPPGGRLTEQTPELLRELGYSYHSPAGEREGIDGGLAVLPFRWRLIDAYFHLPHFAGLRRRGGDPVDPLPLGELRDRLLAALDRHAGERGHLALLFHPFLVSIDPEAVLGVMSEILGRVRELEDARAVRCLRMDVAARRMLDHPEIFERAPELDTATWS